MRLRDRCGEALDQRPLLIAIGPERRCDAVGAHGLRQSGGTPIDTIEGIAHEVEQDRFMIAFQEHAAMGLCARDQGFDRFAAVRPAIHVVAEKNLDDVRKAVAPHVGIDRP